MATGTLMPLRNSSRRSAFAIRISVEVSRRELGPCRLRRQPRARLPSNDVGRRESPAQILPRSRGQPLHLCQPSSALLWGKGSLPMICRQTLPYLITEGLPMVRTEFWALGAFGPRSGLDPVSLCILAIGLMRIRAGAPSSPSFRNWIRLIQNATGPPRCNGGRAIPCALAVCYKRILPCATAGSVPHSIRTSGRACGPDGPANCWRNPPTSPSEPGAADSICRHFKFS